MEAFKRKFFNGVEMGDRKISWVCWDKVLASKVMGGLGVESFFSLKRVMIFKWVWRFLSQNDALWVKVIKVIHGSHGCLDCIPLDGEAFSLAWYYFCYVSA